MTGAWSSLASYRPVSRFVEPGPAMAKHAAGRPVSLPYALAANAAAPSWRMPTYVNSPRSSARRIASANPRFECPTMPNTCVTPYATSVSTSTSATVHTASTRAGSRTKTPSSRSSTGYATGASEKPAGGFPVVGL